MTGTAVMTVPRGNGGAVATRGDEESFAQLFTLAEQLVPTGFLPKHIRTPGQAVAIILAGRELGIGPMLALRSITLVEGKVSVAADLQLARFKADGGRAAFKELTEKRAELQLRHPNGDEHTESFSIEDAKGAGLLAKDNWRKYPKAMLRSRVITAGLKSIGYEPTCGAYDPDETEDFRVASSPAAGDLGGSASEKGSNAPARPATGEPAPEPPRLTLAEALALPFPWKGPAKYVGKPLGELSDNMLKTVAGAVAGEIEKRGETPARVRLQAAVALIREDRRAKAGAAAGEAMAEPTLAELQVAADEGAERETLTEKFLELLDSPHVAPAIREAARAELQAGIPLQKLRDDVLMLQQSVARDEAEAASAHQDEKLPLGDEMPRRRRSPQEAGH